MTHLTTALIILYVSLIVSRFVAEVGLKTLSTEQKGLLVEVMAPYRKLGLIYWCLMGVLAFKNLMYIVIGIMVYAIAHQGVMHWQSKRLSLPSIYMKYSLVTSAIVLVGINVYLAIMMNTYP